jgi:hypothetical protein
MTQSIDHDVPVLRVHVRSSETPGAGATAVFEVLHGSHPPVTIAELATSQLGLPDLIQSTHDVVEDRLQIPETLQRMLVGTLNQATADPDPVCLLDLPAPHGYLHLFPWERLLAADLKVPMVRLPRYELVPRAKWPLLVTIVAGCSPRRPPFSVAAMVDDAVKHWRGAYRDHDLTIDIFVPASEVETVRHALDEEEREEQEQSSATHEITIHEPPDNADIGWRTWVGSALEGRAVDVLHLIGHGCFAGERGLFLLPRILSKLPERRVAVDGENHEMASELQERSIDSSDLCASLTRMGAWALLVTAPAENDSPAALRDLSTAVTETRSGVVMLHQYSAAADTHDQAEESFRMLTGQVRGVRMPDISCWHPVIAAWFIKGEGSGALSAVGSALTEPDGTTALIDAATASVLAAPNAPAWVASGTRTLETLHAQLLGSASSPPNPDAVEALRSVSASFNQQVLEWSHQHLPGEMTT